MCIVELIRDNILLLRIAAGNHRANSLTPLRIPRIPGDDELLTEGC